MTSLTRSQIHSFTVHFVLFIVLALWMVPQIYMLSIGK